MKHRILSINCSNARWTALGLSEGGTVCGEMNLDLGKRQSSFLPSLVDFFLRCFSFKVQDLDFIAVVNGPGSFTGIKVGVAFSQFLAWAAGEKPVIPLSSLESLVFGRPGSSQSHICPLLWAGGGRVYSALYAPAAAGEHPKEAMPPRAYSRDELQAALFPSEERHARFSFFRMPPKNAPVFFPAAFPVLSNLHPHGVLQMSFLRDCTKRGLFRPRLSRHNISVNPI